MCHRFAAPVRVTARFTVACAAALLFVPAVRSQADDVLPSGGMESLNAEWKKHHELANDLLRGFRVADPRDQSHVEAIDTQAKYDTYRFTWVTLQQKPGELANVYRGGVELAVSNLNKGKPGTAGAIAVYVPKATEHALEVLKTQRLIARLNAARVLAKLAELGSPELSDALVPVLADAGQSDAVKFYIVRALKVLAEQQPPVLSAEREKKVAEALAAFVDRKMTIADTTRREDVEGFRYVRREAIRALGQIRNPGAAANGQGPFTLLRIVAKDGPVPPPRIDERVEAVLGLARLKSSLENAYNPDYAIAQIGLFLEEYNREVTAARELLLDNKIPQHFGYKVMSAELYDAIDQMRVDASDNPYVVTLAGACLRLLEKLEKGVPADPEEILQIIATTPPPSKRLFKNVEDTVVRPANRHDNQDAALPALPQLETKPAAAGSSPFDPPAGKDAKPGAPAAPAPAGAAKPASPFDPPADKGKSPAPPPPAPMPGGK
jgi:hypothetical protein